MYYLRGLNYTLICWFFNLFFFSLEDDNFRVGLDKDVYLEIKPRTLSGVLLSVHNRKKDFMVLQMVNGTVNFINEIRHVCT